ncbi:MAG: ATP-binding protein [Polyangiaceae bacterium]
MAELVPEAGEFSPRYCAFVGDARDSDVAFPELPGWPAQPNTPADASASRVAGAGAERTWVIGLDVEPRFAQSDTWLIVWGGGARFDWERIEAARISVTAVLSERRRALLGRLVLAAVEQADDPIELTDRSARIFYVNRSWQARFGFSSEQALGRHTGALLRSRRAPSHDANFYRFTEASVAQGKSWLGLLVSVARAGDPIVNEVNVTPFTSPADEYAANIAIRRDVANRADRDRALAAAHQEFRAVLSAVPDGVTVLRDGRVYFANAAFFHLVERDETQVVGQPFIDFILPEDRTDFEQRAASGVVYVRMSRPNGSPRYVEISGAGAISFEGSPATILLFRDATDRRLSEEQLAHADRLSALGELAAGVAHELNNPMAYVTANLETIRTQFSAGASPEALEALDDALDGARRVQAITAELRLFSRADEDSTPEPVDVRRAVGSAVKIAQTQIRYKAELLRELEADLFVLAREGTLVQVLVNLLTNAGQAIADEATDNFIRVSARARSDDLVEIAVTDSGSGIPAAILPRIFEPFTTTKPRTRGSGLGLAICRRIIERLGGSISASNNAGRGTTVTFMLPRAAAPSRRSRERVSADVGRRLRILVVDDEVPIARALRRALIQHEVSVATRAEEGLALLMSDAFDVVLCDLMMPGMSGAKLYATACERRPELAGRFVFISGGALSDEEGRLARDHERHFISKPFSNQTVLETIERVMAGL